MCAALPATLFERLQAEYEDKARELGAALGDKRAESDLMILSRFGGDDGNPRTA